MANFPATIRQLFDQFYASFKGKADLNIVLHSDPGVAGEFGIACGIQLDRIEFDHASNASTPGGTVTTTVCMGPYDQMKRAH
jgi:hypothetical protein